MSQRQSKSNGNNANHGILGRFFTAIIAKIIVIVIFFIALIYLLIYLLNVFSQNFSEISENFNSGKVVNDFRSYITKLEGTNRLQVASIESIDRFSKKDSQSILWNLISLPDVVVELQAPVEYTFFIDLKKQWEFRWEEIDTSIVVIAPALEIGTPAVDVSGMEINEKESSFLRDEDEVKEKLRLELSEKLKYSASDKIPLIREIARKEVRNFIGDWFVRFYFRNLEFSPEKISVYFSNETIPVKRKKMLRIEKRE